MQKDEAINCSRSLARALQRARFGFWRIGCDREVLCKQLREYLRCFRLKNESHNCAKKSTLTVIIDSLQSSLIINFCIELRTASANSRGDVRNCIASEVEREPSGQ